MLVVEYEAPPISPIVPIIIGVISVGFIGGIVYSQVSKKKKRRQILENSTYVKNLECSKCGTKIQSSF